MQQTTETTVKFNKQECHEIIPEIDINDISVMT
jgi:hypothetical protein